jgi:hypothetical protein
MTSPSVTLNEVKGLNVRFFASLRMTERTLRMTGSEGLSVAARIGLRGRMTEKTLRMTDMFGIRVVART